MIMEHAIISIIIGITVFAIGAVILVIWKRRRKS
tara:strand:+ start:1137 stop:1238 length:102 start_codon:yes stop_codon:yes gene_type:complete